jgi:hypothetical protein
MSGPPRLVTALRSRRVTYPSVRGWAATVCRSCAPDLRLAPGLALVRRTPRSSNRGRTAHRASSPRLGPDARPAYLSADGRPTALCSCASHPARLSPNVRPVHPPADVRPTAPHHCALRPTLRFYVCAAHLSTDGWLTVPCQQISASMVSN